MSTTPTPEGTGAVSGAPNLPEGFADTFTSRYIDTGDVRLHAVIGATARRCCYPRLAADLVRLAFLMPALAEDFEVIAVDQRGSGSPTTARWLRHRHPGGDLVVLMDALGHERFAVYGTDGDADRLRPGVGLSGAGRTSRRLRGLPPGVSPSPPLFVPPILNARLWHLMFNQLPAEVNEALVRGRGHLLRRGVRRVGGDKEAPRRDRRVLRRHACLDPEGCAAASSSTGRSPRRGHQNAFTLSRKPTTTLALFPSPVFEGHLTTACPAWAALDSSSDQPRDSRARAPTWPTCSTSPGSRTG